MARTAKAEGTAAVAEEERVADTSRLKYGSALIYRLKSERAIAADISCYSGIRCSFMAKITKARHPGARAFL